MTQVASFDVFDTLLTRALGSPEAAFLALGRRLLQERVVTVAPAEFAHARVEAERRAFANAGGECTLEAIHAELGAALRLDRARQQDLLEREYAVEAELIRAVPGAAERVERARSLGRQIVFVSDSYFRPSFVENQLLQHGLWRSGDRCYVSCAHGKSKQAGALFLEVVRQEGVPPRCVTHQGNSPVHDIHAARRVGLRVEPYLAANPNRYEALLESHAVTTEGLSSALAGASRLARLGISASTSKDALLRDVAAGVTAPTLAGFTLWVLHRAQELGLERLYFLSRDGQILLSIARRLASKLRLSCELHYLYGSRQAWNLPAIISGSDAELIWIWDHTDILSVKSLLARVGLESESLSALLEAAGLGVQDWSRPLRDAERRLLRQLLETEGARALIVQRAREKRGLLLNYLRQEGVLRPGRWGFVDLGWHGSMQNSLAAVLQEGGGTQPVGLYFALYQGEVVDTYPHHREAYYFDARQRLGYVDAVPELIAMMEMFCSADHGTVIDFADDAGRIRPVMKENPNQALIDWGLAQVHSTIHRFADALVLDDDLVNVRADVRGATTDVLRLFWLHPSVMEARAWAEFPWEDGLGAETYRNRVARRYTWQDVVNTILRGRFELHHRAAWHAGSWALSDLDVQLALKVARRAVRQMRSLRRRWGSWR